MPHGGRVPRALRPVTREKQGRPVSRPARQESIERVKHHDKQREAAAGATHDAFHVRRTRAASCPSFRCRSLRRIEGTAILACMRRARKEADRRCRLPLIGYLPLIDAGTAASAAYQLDGGRAGKKKGRRSAPPSCRPAGAGRAGGWPHPAVRPRIT